MLSWCPDPPVKAVCETIFVVSLPLSLGLDRLNTTTITKIIDGDSSGRNGACPNTKPRGYCHRSVRKLLFVSNRPALASDFFGNLLGPIASYFRPPAKGFCGIQFSLLLAFAGSLLSLHHRSYAMPREATLRFVFRTRSPYSIATIPFLLANFHLSGAARYRGNSILVSARVLISYRCLTFLARYNINSNWHDSNFLRRSGTAPEWGLAGERRGATNARAYASFWLEPILAGMSAPSASAWHMHLHSGASVMCKRDDSCTGHRGLRDFWPRVSETLREGTWRSELEWGDAYHNIVESRHGWRK